MKIQQFTSENGVPPDEAIRVMQLAEKVSATLDGSDTATALNSLVFVIAEFIAHQDEELRAEAIKIVSKAIEDNIPFFVEAHERFKVMETLATAIKEAIKA